MAITQKFLAARAEEQRNRCFTHLPVPPGFRVPLINGRTCFVDQVHYTERIRLELVLLGNPLVTVGGADPTRREIEQVLWRLHPLFYRRATRNFPNLPNQPGRSLWLLLDSWWERRRLRRALARAALALTAHTLRLRLDAAEQDRPSVEDAGTPAPAAPPINAWDDMADYFVRTYGLDPERVLDLPRALLWQLHRNRLLSGPEGELEVMDPSDRFLA